MGYQLEALLDSRSSLSDLAPRQRPSGMAGKTRHTPDRFLPRLSRLTIAPTDAALRAEFVRYCMALFCRRRHYNRLANIFSSAPVEYCKSRSQRPTYLKSLFLVLTNENNLDDGDHLKMLKVVYTEMSRSGQVGSAEEIDPDFIRLVNIASDVLCWDDRDVDSIESEYVEYVQPAWLVLCDELEYEMEESDNDRHDPSDAYFEHQENKATARTKAGAKAQADADKREAQFVRLDKVLSRPKQIRGKPLWERR